ncbi:MAG: ribosome recycling factor [Nitrospirae bacterium]|nr:ribosome recycling factor [Nitrospirota bacterium]
MLSEQKKKAEEKMSKALDVLRKEFTTLRTGRASLGMLDGIMVDFYGTPTALNQVSNLAMPDPRMITIQPWEPKMLGEIEKAILKSDVGITPSNDGKIIRLGIPPLTEERRQQIVKHAKKLAEDARVAVRNIRRDVNDDIKKKSKDKETHVSEDEVKKLQDEIQKTTDSYIIKIDDLLAHKEKEIMTV